MLMYAYEGSQKRPDESKLSPAVFCSPSPGFPSGIRAAPCCGALYTIALFGCWRFSVRLDDAAARVKQLFMFF